MDALLQVSAPVNRFPELVSHLVRRLKVLCPAMGKRRIADTLARAGLRLSATTVGRMLKAKPALPARPAHDQTQEERGGIVTARHPTMSGMWT